MSKLNRMVEMIMRHPNFRFEMYCLLDVGGIVLKVSTLRGGKCHSNQRIISPLDLQLTPIDDDEYIAEIWQSLIDSIERLHNEETNK